MQKTKRKNFFVVAVLIFSMLTMYGSMPMARAASLDSLSDTISDSDIGAIATHTIEFNMVNDLPATRAITVTFDADFDLTSASTTCPVNTTETGSAGQNIVCVVDGGETLSSTTDLTIIIDDVENPDAGAGAGAYTVTVSTNNAIEAESSDTIVYIIDDVSVTASVDATLTFGVAALAVDQDVNGSSTTIESTATTIPFGTLTVDTPEIIGQTLTVATNARSGYTVTVQQDQNMTSAAGADIDAFKDATVGVPDTWDSPSESLSDENTYGHLGFTTSDNSLSTGDTYGSNLYKGFNGTTAVEVMYHNGPADGNTEHSGKAYVGYQVEISDLQEAGDYESTLTYICTPTF